MNNFKARGILFKPEMLEAAENGTKTQTRRICKKQPITNVIGIFRKLTNEFVGFNEFSPSQRFVFGKCPYGVPGDYLYVKEGWKLIGCNFDNGEVSVQYKNGDKKTFDLTGEDISDWLLTKIDNLENRGILKESVSHNDEEVVFEFTDYNYPYESPLFMPKFIARKFFKIKNVRIEKLQSISEEDAASEGVLKDVEFTQNFETKMIYRSYTEEADGCFDARSSFMTLWQKINGKESWTNNPFVWVIEFEKVDIDKIF